MDECDKEALYVESCRPNIYERHTFPHTPDYTGNVFNLTNKKRIKN